MTIDSTLYTLSEDQLDTMLKYANTTLAKLPGEPARYEIGLLVAEIRRQRRTPCAELLAAARAIETSHPAPLLGKPLGYVAVKVELIERLIAACFPVESAAIAVQPAEVEREEAQRG